jgi:hypothetical protein
VKGDGFMRSAVAASIGAMVLTGALWTGVPLGAQSTPAPRTADGRPNLNGLWQAVNSANWDIEAHEARPGPLQFGALMAAPAGLGVVEGEIPYKPEAAAKKRQNFQKRWTEDPEAKCYLPGVPRANYMPFPFQIVQGTDKILMIYEFAAAVRTIHLDDVPAESLVDSWMGHSVGRFEGQTLVVDVTGFNGMAWFDRAGNFQSDTLHVVERYTPIDANAIDYQVTIEDPALYTRTWTMRMPLYRRLEKNMQLLEFRCVPFSEDLLYGDLRKKPTR